MSEFIECPNCKAKMPAYAKFCGFCGCPLEKIVKDEKLCPIWELFKPNAFLKYKVFGESLVTYKVIQVKGNIIEFLMKEGTKNYYLYIDKNRRHWAPKEMPDYLFMDERSLEKRYPIEKLKPVDYFTHLWIDITRVKLGEKIPVHNFEMQVSSKKKIGSKLFYVTTLSPSGGSLDYYDAKTGLLYRSTINDVLIEEELYASWINL